MCSSTSPVLLTHPNSRAIYPHPQQRRCFSRPETREAAEAPARSSARSRQKAGRTCAWGCVCTLPAARHFAEAPGRGRAPRSRAPREPGAGPASPPRPSPQSSYRIQVCSMQFHVDKVTQSHMSAGFRVCGQRATRSGTCNPCGGARGYLVHCL